MDIIYLAIAAYMIGCLVALGCIELLNDEEIREGGIVLIPEWKCFYSWALVLYVIAVFADTFTKHRE